MSIKAVTGPRAAASTGLTYDDDVLLQLGDDDDAVLVLNSAALNANTAVTSVLEGTPVSPALAANSLIIANETNDGDILLAISDGGNSKGLIKLNGSDGTVDFSGSLLPVTDDTYDLGSAAAAWQDLFIEGDITMTDAGTISTGAGDLTLSSASLLKITTSAALRSDSIFLYLGAGDDATLKYDGTNLLINPKAVGSGYAHITGDLKVNAGGDEGSVVSVLNTNTGTQDTDANTTETNLYTYTLPVATFVNVGDSVCFHAAGAFGGNGNTKTLAAYVGGTGGTKIGEHAGAHNGTHWEVTARTYMAATDVQRSFCQITVDGVVVDNQYQSSSVDDGATIELLITGLNGTASNNDIVKRIGSTTFYPAHA